MMPRTTLLLAVLVLAIPSVATAQQPDPAKALREAIGSLQGSGSRELAEARKRWPRYQEAIGLEMSRQDAAVQAGGRELDDKIALYETKTDLQETPVNRYLAGRINGLAGRIDAARVHFERCIVLDKFFYWGYHGLGTYFAMRKMPEPAAKQYGLALELNPEFHRAARGLAMCQMQMGRYDEAESSFRRILTKTPDDIETRKALAKMFIRANRYVDAINEFNVVKQRGGDKVDSWLAHCYVRTDQLDEAVAIYKAILERDPKDWAAAVELGKIYQRTGKNHEAAAWFQRALDNLPLQTRFDREKLEEVIAVLLAMPAVSKVNPNRKSPGQWVDILLNSVEVDRRRVAARIISGSPYRHPEFDSAMLRALRDKDYLVRVRALRTVGRWWGEVERLADPGLVGIFSLLLNDRHHAVRGMAANILARSEHARVVPPLMERLQKERNAYVFRQIHRALNRNTFAYISVSFDEELGAEDMERLSREWKAWYDKNIYQFRKYEEERKK